MEQKPPIDDVARTPGMVLPAAGTVSDEEFEILRRFSDPRANAKPEDYYGFSLIASSDGVDSYFTRQDPRSSLRNFASDLKSGQALLGSHLIQTFSYGTSYDGQVVQADPSRAEYEATFYRRHASTDRLRAKNWVVGKYALVRNMKVNGENTDDLIRGIERGAIRRVSVSFNVGAYRCELDNEDMVQGFFGPEGKKCTHFPGVEYSNAGVATALMVDNDLHETSLVYKNSSPGAMIMRKAEALARDGILPSSEVAKLEQRFQVRLPRYERTVFAGAQVPPQREVHVLDADGNEVPGAVADVAIQLTDEVSVAGTPPTEEEEATEATPATPETRSADQRLVALEARYRAIRDVLGEEPTVERIKGLVADAKLGHDLFDIELDKAVKARTAVDGENFNALKWRALLASARDLELVQNEIESWTKRKGDKFTDHRQVVPVALPERDVSIPTRQPNLIESLGLKKES